MASKSKRQQRRLGICAIILGVVAALFLFIGVYMPAYMTDLLNDGVKRLLVVSSKDSPSYKTWVTERTDTVPRWRNAYFFHLNNPDGFLRGELANVTEIGPYVYREYVHKINVSFPDNGNRAKYNLFEQFIFHPELSCDECHEDRILTTVNIPLQAVVGRLNAMAGKGLSVYAKVLTNIVAAIADEPLLVNKTVYDVLWGYEDPLLKLLAPYDHGPAGFPGLQQNMTSAADVKGFNEMMTGKDNIDNINMYTMWRNQRTLDVWGSPHANAIRGTDGTQFAPGTATVGAALPAFIDVLHLSTFMKYESTMELYGIKLNSFGVDPLDLKNATQYPPNAGYYMDGPPGVFNLTSAEHGVPAFISKPHFLDASEYYRRQVIGMHPNRTIHDTHVDVEATIGTVLRARQRLQINVLMKPLIAAPFNKAPQTYFPIGWIEQAATVTPALAEMVKGKVYLAQDVAAVARWSGLSLGLILFVCFALVTHKWVRVARQRKQKAKGAQIQGADDDDSSSNSSDDDTNAALLSDHANLDYDAPRTMQRRNTGIGAHAPLSDELPPRGRLLSDTSNEDDDTDASD